METTKLIANVYFRFVAILAALSLMVEAPAYAQLQIVEILSNSVNDDNWEWVEVQNTSGTPLDLNGFVFDDDDGGIRTAPNIDNANGNTVIPAGGHAVLYNGAGLEFSEARFRNAWQLGASVPLIGVSAAPGLNNGGDAIGLWLNIEEYTKDVDPVAGEVLRFDNAIFSIDFETGFASPNDTSIFYSGVGDIKDGANWMVSVPGQNGAKTSIATFFETAQVNSIEDIGNPGKVPGGTGAGLQITEIMFNPRSEDNDWEWVEVRNGTGSTINFAETPFVFDDEGGSALDAANVTTGSIADGEVAVLFNGDAISVANMKDAWGQDVNVIPVSGFSALNNGGDSIGLWDDFAMYTSDKAANGFASARATVTYLDVTAEGWPSDDGNGSFYLSSLDANPTEGASWLLSQADDGLSSNATAAFETMIPDHPGGDVGSPGVGPGEIMSTNGDFDGDGDLDVDDLDAIAVALRAGTSNELFDVNGNGTVEDADRVFWIETLKNTYIGDSNLDGEFGSTDLVLVFQAGEYEDTTIGNSTWVEGDWNGDGEFNTSDLVAAFQSGGFEQGPRAIASVPEPSSIVLLSVALVGIVGRRRRCS